MGAGRETTLHVVAAILRMLHDPHTLPFAPALMRYDRWVSRTN